MSDDIKVTDGTILEALNGKIDYDGGNYPGSGLEAIVKKSGGGVGLQMFDTVLKDHVLTYEKSKGLALQGTYVYKEAIAGSRYGYADFYNKCLEEKEAGTATEVTLGDATITMYVNSNGHQFYDIADKEAVDIWFETYGFAWFYGIDTENECVFLPRNNWFEQATGVESEAGLGVEAGLPNIEGKFSAGVNDSFARDGVLFTGISYGAGSKGVAGSYDSGISFDASRYNQTYGNSDTVQPNAVKKLLYICVGNTVADTSWVDVVTQVKEGVKDIEEARESSLDTIEKTTISCVDEVEMRGAELRSKMALSMFDTILKDHILTYEESKGLALQGTYVYKNAVAGSRYGYPDFYNKVIEEFNEATETETVNGIEVKVHSNGHKFYDIANKDAIDSFFNTMGSAWFYGIDIENERIFLPRNNNFEQMTGDVSEIGKSIEAGLPNITGYFDTLGAWYSTNLATDGAFTTSGNSATSFGLTKGNGNDSRRKSFDASRSNPIYGNSDTVQPNSVKKLLYICVGNTVSDTSWVDVVTQVEGGVKDIEVAEEEAIARLKATSNALNQTQITNCLLEVPQNIKLELNEGVLTLKAGSKVIVPNGVGVFDEVVIEKDLVLNQTANGTCTLYCQPNGKKTIAYSGKPTSGETDPEAGKVAYNTTSNMVKRISTTGVESQLSFPIATIVMSDTTVTSIEETFNGMGYIGMHGWIDKGVKILIPNGRNADGTLNNIEHTTQKIIVRTVQYGANSFYWWLRSIDAFDVFGQSEIFVSETEPIYNGRCEWYNPKENIIRYKKTTDSDFIVYDGVIVALSGGIANGVTSLQPKLPFRAVDYSDKSIISGWGMPSNKYIDLTLGASGTEYTAPANGYFNLSKNGNTNQYIYMTVGFLQQLSRNTANGAEATVFVPIRKGDKCKISYTAAGSTNHFRFIYAEGEV